jgi:hypothetical protein
VGGNTCDVMPIHVAVEEPNAGIVGDAVRNLAYIFNERFNSRKLAPEMRR